MKDSIGKVVLNYRFYSGSDLYSDGDAIEEEMLEIARSGNWEEEVQKGNRWPILYHFSDIRGNIIDWYPMNSDASVLEIGCGCGGISGFLCKKVKKVIGVELSERRALINAYRNCDCGNFEIVVGNFKDIVLEEKFDYVTLIGVLEYASQYMGTESPYEDMLKKIQTYLKPGGKIIIAIENKMGLKYLNGAKEDHVGKRFAGMEDYRYISGVRTFSRQEMAEMLQNCGIEDFCFYYPMPDYKLPDTVYSDSYMPRKGDVRIWNTNYDTTRIALYNDGIMADQVCGDKMFGYFANSFFVVANECEQEIIYAHYTNQRLKEYQTVTRIKNEIEGKYVEKKYLWRGERDYDIFRTMNRQCAVLQKEFKNIVYLPAELLDDPVQESIRYPYLAGKTLDEILMKDIHAPEKLINALENAFCYCFSLEGDYLSEFEMTEEYREIFGDIVLPHRANTLRVSNLDMSFSNLILCEEKIFCFDYEWVFHFPIPVEFMKFRCLNSFFSKFNMYFAARLKKGDIMKRIGIREEDFAVLNQMEIKFQEFTYGKGNFSQYLQRYRKPCGVLECRGM